MKDKIKGGIYMKGIEDIQTLTRRLADDYPIEDMYGSRASLYGRGLKEDRITKEQYENAKKYYGNLWNYVGD